MGWELCFREYLDRVGEPRANTSLEVGLWNDLASYLLRARLPKWSKPANCQLPVDRLLALSPENLLLIAGIGPAKAGVYKRLYESLKAHPEQARDLTFEISREGLALFAPRGTPPRVVTMVWNRFMAAVLIPEEAPTIARLERFCVDMQDKKKRHRLFSDRHLKLLEAWLQHLRKAK